MTKIRSNPNPVKLFIGMISQDSALFEQLKDELQNIYGLSDFKSPVWQWEDTDYYLKEMGAGLKRQFIFFQRLINPEIISGIKFRTTELEKQYLNKNGGRRINIDPGYLDSARVVLVSAKDFSHRIYLGNGIYGEVTLIYSGNAYQTLPYTYPDFRTQEYFDIFEKARELYKAEISQRG